MVVTALLGISKKGKRPTELSSLYNEHKENRDSQSHSVILEVTMICRFWVLDVIGPWKVNIRP